MDPSDVSAKGKDSESKEEKLNKSSKTDHPQSEGNSSGSQANSNRLVKKHAGSDIQPNSSSSSSLTKRQRLNTPPTAPPYTLAASPPKFISFEELMQVANGVTNMALAHEIALDNDFKLESLQPPENSFQKQVKEVMHKAFWDVLKEQLAEEPPNYEHAIKLLHEIKQVLLDLLLPQHVTLQNLIEEALDMELIQQKAINNAIDIDHYAQFVLTVMSKLCAPIRDEQILALKQTRDVVALYKGIFELIDKMKLDMANFTLQQVRPQIQLHGVEYEKQKFKEFLETQTDGLQYTRMWLQRGFEKLKTLESEVEGATAAEITTTISPASILNQCYLDLLVWDIKHFFPETLLMDQGRFMGLRDKTSHIKLVASVLLVTYNTVGGAISGISSFKEKLKDKITIVLTDTPESEKSSTLLGLSSLIAKEVNKCLNEHGYKSLSEEQETALKGQISELGSDEHPVYKVISSRVTDFIRSVAMSTTASPVKVPAGLATMDKELMQVCGQFLRLVDHNRAVFGQYYADIIRNFLGLTDMSGSISKPENESTVQ